MTASTPSWELLALQRQQGSFDTSWLFCSLLTFRDVEGFQSSCLREFWGMAWLPARDTHWGYGPPWQPRLGGAGGVCLWFKTDSSGGHWTVWVLVEVHINALAATFMELIANDLSLLLISKVDSSQGEWSPRTAWAFIKATAYILH